MTLEVQKPSEAEVARAEASVAVARDGGAARKWSDRLEEPFALEEDEADAEMTASGNVVTAWLSAGARALERVREYAADYFFGHDVPSPSEAAWALDQILKAEDEAEEVKRRAEARIERSARRAKWIREMLWPSLVRYCEVAPRSTKKGWKFEGTDARLVMKDSPGRLTVKDRAEALRWVKSVVGTDEAIEREIVRVREELSEAKLRDWLEAKGDASAPTGTEREPAGERLTLYRR